MSKPVNSHPSKNKKGSSQRDLSEQIQKNHSRLKGIPSWAKLFVFSLILCGHWNGGGLHGAIRIVTSTNDTAASGVPGELRSEVAAASNGDTIQFSAGLTGQTITLDLASFGPIAMTSSNGNLIFDSITTSSDVSIRDLYYGTNNIMTLTGTSISFQMTNGLPIYDYYSTYGHPLIFSSSDSGQFITIKTGVPSAAQSTLAGIQGTSIGVQFDPSSSSDTFTFEKGIYASSLPLSYAGQTILLNPCTVEFECQQLAPLTTTFNTEFVLPNTSTLVFNSLNSENITWVFNKPFTVTGTPTIQFSAIAGVFTSTINLNNEITGNINFQGLGPVTHRINFNAGSSVSGTFAFLAGPNSPDVNIADTVSIGAFDFTARTAGIAIAAGQHLTLGSIIGSSTEGYTINAGAQFTIGGDNSSSTIASGAHITGSGNLTKSGTGTLTVNSVNAGYTGHVFINSGTLTFSSLTPVGTDIITLGSTAIFQAASGGALSLPNPLVLSNGSTIDTTSGTILTMTSVFSGASGTLNKTGAGTLIMGGGSNINTYGGTTTVSAGTLQLNAAGAFPSGNALTMSGGTFAMNNRAATVGTLSGSSGTITTGGAVVLTVQNSSGTYSGDISGVGSLTKSTSGTLTLGGTTSLASMTATGGTLVMNGTTTLTGNLTVNAGATLKGTGTITANLVTVSGTTAPGNSIGTLNIVGDFTQAAGSTYQNELDPTSTDLLIVTGTVDLTASPTLQIIVLPGTYLAPNTYTIIQAGVVHGMFGPIIISDPSFSATVSYPGTSVVLNLVPIAFNNRGLTGNPQIVATALDTIGSSAGADLNMVIGVLQLLPTLSALESALNQLHPANLNGFAIVQEVNTTNLTSLLSYRLQPIYNPCCGSEDKYVFWTDALGDFLTQESRYLFPGYKARTWGFLSGFDIKVTKRGLFGLLGGYTSSTVWWRHHFDNGLMNSGYGGVYGGFSVPYFYLDMAAIGSYVSFDATRKIAFSTISRHAHSRHHGYGVDGHLEMGFLLGSCNEIRPFGSADFNFLHEQGYTETGASGLNLVVRKRNSTYLKSQGGLIYTRCINFEESRLVPEAGISYVHEQRYQGRYTFTKFVDTTVSMKIHNVNPNRDLISFLAGIRWIFKEDLASMALFYNGEFGSHYDSQLGSFELKVGF